MSLVGSVHSEVPSHIKVAVPVIVFRLVKVQGINQSFISSSRMEVQICVLMPHLPGLQGHTAAKRLIQLIDTIQLNMGGTMVALDATAL